jgi:predicted amidophosphoribosyltransferase
MSDGSWTGDRGDIPTRILLGTFSTDHSAPLHDLLRTARTGDVKAISEILERVRIADTLAWPAVERVLVVAVPGHRTGPANGLVLAVAGALALAHGWDQGRDALRRIRPSPEAKAGGARDAAGEAATLDWQAAPEAGTIVLVDDVIRTGTTLAACLTAIRTAGDVRPVFAAVLAARA